MASALALGAVSGWATYDRLMTSIITSRVEHQANQDQRQADLIEQRGADAARIEQLDADATAVHQQAIALRERGMVSRALELESAALARIDAERAAANDRRDTASQELTALRGQATKAAGIPMQLATLLCLGFALALEVVPALILAALRHEPGPVAIPATVPATQEQAAERPQEHAKTAPETATPDALPPELLQLLAGTGSGEKVAVRQVAKALRIGSDKATKLMQRAAEVGALNKTASGYVAT